LPDAGSRVPFAGRSDRTSVQPLRREKPWTICAPTWMTICWTAAAWPCRRSFQRRRRHQVDRLRARFWRARRRLPCPDDARPRRPCPARPPRMVAATLDGPAHAEPRHRGREAPSRARATRPCRARATAGASRRAPRQNPLMSTGFGSWVRDHLRHCVRPTGSEACADPPRRARHFSLGAGATVDPSCTWSAGAYVDWRALRSASATIYP
jgi:hypothetical protein